MTEVQQALVIKPAFEVGARINTRRSMSLKVDKVARLVAVGGVEEMLVAHFQQGGQRGIGREMAADARILFILAMHHGHRVPADKGFQPLLELAVTGVGYFLMLRDGVEVGGRQRAGGGDAGLACPLPQCGNQLCSLFMAFADHQVVECLNPLCYLVRKLRLRGYSDFGFHRN